MTYKKFILIIYLLIPFTVFAQLVVNNSIDSTVRYIKSNGYYTGAKDSAAIIRIVSGLRIGAVDYTVHDYYPNGKIKLTTKAKHADGSGFSGPCAEYFKNGIMKNAETYENDTLIGSVVAYYPDGKTYMSGEFKNGDLVVNECYDTTGGMLALGGEGEFISYNDERTEITDRGPIVNGLKTGLWSHYENGILKSQEKMDHSSQKYPTPEVAAQFKKGGIEGFAKFISQRLHYTEEAKKNAIKGKVFITFVVEKDGSVSNIKLLRGLGYGLDQSAMEVIKLSSGLWVPAKLNNEIVTSQYTVPIGFGMDGVAPPANMQHDEGRQIGYEQLPPVN